MTGRRGETSTLRQLVASRELVRTLTLRDLKARYRGSLFGFFWSLANPLLLLAVYSAVFTYLLRGARGDIEPYGVFLATGLFPWIWTSGALQEAADSLTVNSGLIRKSVFPVEVLPVVVVLSHFVHFVLALPVLAGAFLVARWFGYEPGGWHALLVPLLLAVHLVALSGLALGVAALTVHFKDVRDLLANVLTLLFFLAPILYPLSLIASPWVRGVIHLNPYTPYTLAYQDLLFHDRLPSLAVAAQVILIAAVFWLAGSWVFRRLSDTLTEAA